MSPQEGRGYLGVAGQASREAARRLLAALSSSGTSASESGRPRGDSTSLLAIVDSALADPDRLKAVHATGLLDRSDPDLDNAAVTTARALGTPYAAILLMGRDSSLMVGRYLGDTTMDRSIPLESSLCKFAVASAQPFIIDDTQQNPLVADNPMVRTGRIMSYAGMPLMDGNHNVVGALASWDDRPRRWSTGQIQILTNLSAVVAAKIFRRRV